MGNIEERLIETTFRNEFNETNFSEFVKELFNDSRIIEINPEKKNVWKEYSEYIEYFKDHGTYTDPDNNAIKILSVKLKKSSSRDRARVMQRNFIAKFLDGYYSDKQNIAITYDAAIVAFYGEEQKDWRLSFVKMQYMINEELKIEKEMTPVKRYSYLVGPTEPNYTCRKQFSDVIGPKTEVYLKDLESIFSVENVNEEFFDEYENLFLRLKKEIDCRLESNPEIKTEFETKRISSVEFAKKLLGQIVFIYFLQKKGWLGIKQETNGDFAPWGAGPRDFLKKLYATNEYTEYNNFFKDVLEPLFYEALSSKRENDYYPALNCKIPFLNGGLFEAIDGYDWKQINLNLSNDLFNDIIEKFDMYNFTVKEDEPLEKEVAIDPEMLGNVFERLLDVVDQKSLGAFYTPREIVHYMCQQSLINYLKTYTDISKEEIENYILMDGFSSADDIRNFLELERVTKKLNESKLGTSNYTKYLNEKVNVIQKFNVPKEIRNKSKLIDDLLKNVKIADPAVGSGAFPVGMMNEIVKARSILTPFLVAMGISTPDERATYNLKRDTIENSLYCVDIDSSATDITKLRFWLSLVVDEENVENIRALPNLDHKIMCGNSLIEEFGGIKLFDESLIEDTYESYENDAKYLELSGNLDKISKKYNEKSSLAQDYTKNQNWKGLDRLRNELEELDQLKKSLDKKINRIKAKYKKETFEAVALDEPEKLKKSRLKLKELRKLHKEFFDEDHKEKKKELWKKIENLEWEVIEAKFKECGNPEKLDELKNIIKSKSKPFFIWRLYFYEVFNEKGGFDIVIGNPPYVQIKKLNYKDTLEQMNYYSFSRSGDIYTLFYELGNEILSKNGNGCYITSNKWLRSKYGLKLRDYFSKKANPSLLYDFSGHKIFKNATVDSAILLWKNQKNEFKMRICVASDKKFNKDFLSDYFDLNFEIMQKISEEPWIVLSKEDVNLKEKIESKGITLKDWNINFYYGILTGANKCFIINEDTRNYLISLDPKNTELIKPLLRGKDIERYGYTFSEVYLLNSHNGIPRKGLPEVNIEKDYPSLLTYFDSFGDSFKKRGEKGKYWYNLRSCNYLDEFEDHKIIYADIVQDEGKFYYDEKQYYTNDTAFLITGESLKYLTTLLNSKLINYIYKSYYAGSLLGESGIRYKKAFLEKIPVPSCSKDAQKPFIEFLDSIQALKYEKNSDEKIRSEIKRIEDSIDILVYKLYSLTYDEIKIVDPEIQTIISEEEYHEFKI